MRNVPEFDPSEPLGPDEQWVETADSRERVTVLEEDWRDQPYAEIERNRSVHAWARRRAGASGAPLSDTRVLAALEEIAAAIRGTRPPAPGTDLMSSDEAAAHLRMSRKALYQAVRAGRIPVHRVGRRMRFSRKEISAVVIGCDSPRRSR